MNGWTERDGGERASLRARVEEEEEEAEEEEEGDTQASSAMDGTRMSTRYQPVHAEL